jgi:hypothetical protein
LAVQNIQFEYPSSCNIAVQPDYGQKPLSMRILAAIGNTNYAF